MSNSKIKDAINKHKEEISRLDGAFIGTVIHISQTGDNIKKALKDIDKLLEERDFLGAAMAGFKDISQEYTYLQRALGALHHLANQKEVLIQSITEEIDSKPYQELYPKVEQKINEMMPSTKKLTPEDIKRNEKIAKMSKEERTAYFKAAIKEARSQ